MAGRENSIKEVSNTQDEACASPESSSLSQHCLEDISRKDDSPRTAERTAGMADSLTPLFIDSMPGQSKPGDLSARFRQQEQIPGIGREIVFDQLPALDRSLSAAVLQGRIEQSMQRPLSPDQVPPLSPEVPLAPDQSPQSPELAPQAAPTIETIKVGAREYQVSAGPDGKVGNINIASPDGRSSLQMQRDANGALRITSANGEFAPQNGRLNFEGIPLIVGADGTVQGELAFLSNGDVKYSPSTGTDRVQVTRKADGRVVSIDFGSWKKTTISADGQAKEQFWDGFEWRQGELQSDGRVKFAKEFAKPEFMKRDKDSDKAVVTFQSGNNYECDFRQMKQTFNEVGPPAKQTVSYYNGANYVEAAQVSDGQPQPGDRTIQFKDAQPGEPTLAILHKDGRVTTQRPDKTMVTKDQMGYVQSVSGPRGSWEFQRDINGDIRQARHTYVGPDGRPMTEMMMREGREMYPGMEHYRSRQGFNHVREPFDLPPRDLERAIDYNTFVDANGNRQRMNINCTADGTVRIERSAGDNKTIVNFESPGQVMYTDTGSVMVAEHPGGVHETYDKATKESVFKFKRAGRDIELKSTEGQVQILTDGTVIQDKAATKTREYYMPNGVQASLDASNAEKPVFKEVSFPGKDGKLVALKNGQDGVSELQLLDNMSVMATITRDNKAVQTVFNPKDGSRSEKSASDKFWRVLDVDGNFVGPAASPGEITWKYTSAGFAGPNGVTFESANWSPANPAIGADGELLLTGKDGSTARLDLNGTSLESKDGNETYRYPNAKQARFEKGKLTQIAVGNKIYRPELAEGDKIIGLAEADGNKANPPGGASYYFDKSMGEFLGSAETKDGVQSGYMWNPADNTNTLWRSWQTASGQAVNLRVKLNDRKQVTEFNLPGSANVVAVANNADIKSSELNAENGVFTVVMADGRTGTFSPDGSYQWQIPGSNPPVVKFDRNGTQVKTA